MLEPDDALREHLCQHHIVDVDDRGKLALLAKLADQPHDLSGRLWVQAGRRLVYEQQLGLLDQRARDTNALPLPPESSSARLSSMCTRPTRSSK